MQEVHFFLIFVLATFIVVALAWLALFSVVSAKSRIIHEQRRALAAEQRLRRAQEAFTDNAHHELRTPLQILIGYLQLLQDLDPRPDQRQLLEKTQKATARLTHLVQELLDLSSLDQGTLTIHPTPSDLGERLAGLAMCFQIGARSKGLELLVDLAPLPRRLVCDAARLSQALEALLDNAVKFTERGTLAFRMTAHGEGRRWCLRFEIEDRGPGLPPDWPRLINPFEQEEHGFRRRHGGLGIGLPLAHGIVGRLGGAMGLLPLPAGTLAWVELILEEVPPSD